ncbi:endonuclease/exonuclease/phosphatase family protein [Commensalibacter oyaizuii]|uniref:Endonuclease/exonuclease/phosphatase family protein n=1 Tax=Commensalibacter oyaizuii TaxID=3043873 RepID=A0ABT6Q1G5_9PROT|nr:endonuclease/exonuclease/phosphatase family protein [Commensalibacter sp. TBRC 16381]MDI2090581.1 endonuclease/exonuclease/phosphatase family protein [Commensalibacter sp. TBRC 16381]
MNKIFLQITLILFYFLTLPVYAQPFKIATWNIEWLLSLQDKQNFKVPSGLALRNAQDFKKLAFYTQKLNADIIALQEIGSLQTLQSIFPNNQYVFFITGDTIAQHTALAVRNNFFDRIQRNSDLTELGHISPPHPLRSGLDITIYKNNHSFRILVVHLKSGCRDQLLNSKKTACLILKQQHPILKKWISDRLNEHQAFIIIGDFNRVLSAHDPFFDTLTSTSPDTHLTIPTAGMATPCGDGNYFIDGFILDPQASHWLVPNSLRVMVYKEQGNETPKTLSDHCPVSIQLEIP